jgi:Ni,Fe-hydrogenase III small subunit/Pyruvate/2-oxoacid:ferredoxin oxidoreductase delta subunit
VIELLATRLKQGHRTVRYPLAPAVLPDRLRGLVVVDDGRCDASCSACVEACPTDALARRSGRVDVDLGRCIGCTDCVRACERGAVAQTAEHRLSARCRADLVVSGRRPAIEPLDGSIRRVLGRALKLRQVSAGGCNACEADTNVLGTIVFDLGRFGIQFVASPRHADGLLVTGPVPKNMKLALEKTYEAVPSPKIVIAVGACAISGGVYRGHPEACDGADGIVPVDLYVPGCPPHPYTILDGLLRLLDRMPALADKAP